MSYTKYDKKKWSELTPSQQIELTAQMTAHKVPAEQQQSLVYLIRADGSVYGYQFSI